VNAADSRIRELRSGVAKRFDLAPRRELALAATAGGGLLFFVHGVAEVYEPAGWITAGALLVVLAVAFIRGSAK
jgi:hypothetical protein